MQEQKKEKTRNSNIELMRVLSMVLIVLYHLIRRYFTAYAGNLGAQPAVVYFTDTLLGIWGMVGVYMFVAISAWFQVDSRFRARHVISVLFELVCYVAVFSALRMWLTYDGASLGRKLILTVKDMNRSLVFRNDHWFVAVYLIMYFLSPCLNLVLGKLSRQQLKTVLAVFTGVMVFGQLKGEYLTQVTMFLYIYLLIGYEKRYAAERGGWMGKGAALAAVMLVFTLIRDNVGFLPALDTINEYTSRLMGRFAANSLISACIAVTLVLGAVRRPPRHDRLVNALGGLALGAYLFHETSFYPLDGAHLKLIDVARRECEAAGLFGGGALYPLETLGLAAAVLLAGCAVEFVRLKLIHGPFMRLVGRVKLDKLDRWMNMEN